MSDYEEIVNASDKKILMALDAELEEISHKIDDARHRYENVSHQWERELCYENLVRLIEHNSGVYEARVIAYKAMQKKY